MPVEDRNGTLYLRFQIEGKKVHVSTGLKTSARNWKKAEAIEVKEREALSLERRFNVRKRENKTFGEAAAEFEQWLHAEYPKPNSARTYRAAFKHARRFFKDRVVSSIDSGDVEQFKVARVTATKPSTAATALMVLSTFFKYCKKRNWCSENPAEDVKWPTSSAAGRTRVLSYEEEKQYFAAIRDDDDDLRDFVLILLNHGLRPNEVLHIQKADVDLDLGRFTIQEGKTASARRSVNMTEETLPIFKRRMESPSPWVFPRANDPTTPVQLNTLNYRHNTVLKRAGLKFVLYSCRHSFATRLLEAGAGTVAVAKLLGHANLATVHKYLHPGDSMLTAAMKAYTEDRRLKLAS